MNVALLGFKTPSFSISSINVFNFFLHLVKKRVSEVIANEILDTLVELEAIYKVMWAERLIWSDNFVKIFFLCKVTESLIYQENQLLIAETIVQKDFYQ